MAIQKQITSPNGVVTNYHKIIKIDLFGDDPELHVHVGSWVTEDSALSNNSPIWNTYLRLPAESLYETVQSKLLVEGEFQNGSILLDPSTLEKAKQRKWIALKSYRDALEFSGFEWDGSRFDSDPVSQSRIQGGVQLAQIATQSGQPFSIDWTLQNNTVRVLNGIEMVQVGLALGTYVQLIHGIARNLRTQLEAATTFEQVDQVNWPI